MKTKPRHTSIRTRLAVLLTLLALPGQVKATTFTWDGGGVDENISTSANWVGGVAPVSNLSTTDLIFAGSAGLNPNFLTAFSANSLTLFDNFTGAFTFGGSTLSLGTGGIVNNSKETITFNNAINFGGVLNSTINTGEAASSSLVFTDTVTLPTGTLTIAGSSEAKLSGASASMTVGSGQTLQLDRSFFLTNGAQLTRASTGAVNIAAGKGLGVFSGSDVSIDSTFVNNTASTISISGSGSTFFSDNLMLNGGSVTNVGSGGTLSTDGAAVIGNDGVGATVTVNGAGSSFNVGSYMTIGTSSGSATLNVQNSGVVNSGTDTTTVNSTGTIAIAGGTYNSLGDLTLSGGQLTLDATGALVLAAGKALAVQTGGDVTVTGSFTNNTASSIVVSGTSTFSATGAVSINGGSTFSVSGSFSSFSADVVNVGTSGGGTLSVNSNADFIVGSTLTIGAASGAAATLTLNSSFTQNSGTGLTTVNPTGTLNIVQGPFNVLGDLTINGGQLAMSSGGTLTLATGKTLTVQNGGALTVSGGFTHSTNSTISIQGSGSTFSTTGALTLSDGTVNVFSGGVLNSGTSGVTTSLIQSGATLAVSGGNFSPGDNVMVNGGTITVSGGTITPAAGKTLTVQNGGALTVSGGFTHSTASTISIQGIGSTFTGGTAMTIGTASGGASSVDVQTGGTFSTGTGVMALNPTAIVNVNGGTLNINGVVARNGGALNFNSGTVNMNVPLIVGPGGALGNDVTLATGKTLNTTSTTMVEAGHTLAIGTGTYNAQGNLTVEGTLTRASTGIFILAAGKTMTVQNGGTVAISGIFDHNTASTINVGGSGSSISVGSHWDLSNGAVLTLQTGGSTSTASGFTTTVNAAGTVNLAGGTLNVNGVFDNNGTFNFTSGTLDVKTGGNFQSGSGTFTVPTGATVSLTGGDFTGEGNVTIDGGQFTRVSGNLPINAGSTFTVQNGGQATLTGGHLVNTASTIFVTGAGSTFTTTSDLQLLGGSTLQVDAAGSVSSGGGILNLGGSGTGSTATFSSASTGSFGSVKVGDSSISGASSTLSVQSGSTVTGTSLRIAPNAVTNSGTVTIAGVGSLLTLSGSSASTIGATTASTSTATLSIQSGGTFSTNTGTTTLNRTGTINLTGGTLSVNGILDDNGGALNFTSGTLNLNTGGTFNTGTGALTLGASGITNLAGGTMNVEGTVDNNGTFNFTSGTLDVKTGGIFQSGTSTVTVPTGATLAINGGSYSSEGDLTIDGGQLNRNSGTFGLAAGKTLTVQSGGIVNLFNGGGNNGSSVVVTGTGSQLNVIGSGSGGMAKIEGGSTFSVLNGGAVSVPVQFTLADVSGSGSLLVDGVGSTLTSAYIRIGNGGATGTATFSNSGAGSFNAVGIADTSFVGTQGTLNINTGGTVTGTSLAIAQNTVANSGTLTISGGGSALTLTGTSASTIGATSASAATLNIQSGGTFATNTGTTTLNPTGTINLAGGIFNQNGTLIRAGGALNFTSGTFNAHVPFVSGASGALGSNVTLTSGKTLNAASTVTIDAGSTLAISGGVFTAQDHLTVNGSLTRDASSAFSVPAGKTMMVQGGGSASFAGVFNHDTASTITITGAGSTLSTTGALSLGGVSTTNVLSGGSLSSGTTATLASGSSLNLDTSTATFTGGLTSSGAVGVTGGASTFNGTLAHSGSFTVGTGATAIFNGAVSGPGNFSGAGTVDFRGGYSPGSSPGIVSIAGDAIFAPANTLTMEITGLTAGTQHDQIQVGGNTTLGGAVNLAFTSNTFFPQTGNNFVIMDTAGTFTNSATFTPSGLRAGWQFSTSYNATTGELTVNSLSKGIPVNAPSINTVWNGSNGNWSDFARWSSNPNFPLNGNANSVYNATQNGGTLTVNLAIDIDKFTLNGGTLTGASTLITSDMLTFSGGSMTGTGTVNALGGVTFSGGGNKAITNTRVLNMSGSSSWTGGNILLQNTGIGLTLPQINNQAGAVFEVSLNGNGAVTREIATSFTGFGSAAFNNAGTFTMSGSTGTVSFTNNFRTGDGPLPVAFNNTSTGVANLNVGTLELLGGGTSSGVFNVAGGATLKIGSGQAYTLASGAVIQGAGNTQLLSTINTNGTVTINTNLALAGSLNAAGGAVSLGDGVTPRTSTWSGGAITLSSGGTVTNKAGSTLTLSFDGNVNAGSGSGTFVNEGTLIKSGGTGIATVFTGFSNSGGVQVNSGTLNLRASGTYTGSFDLGAAGTLRLGFDDFNFLNTHTFTSSSSVTGAAGSLIRADYRSVVNFSGAVNTLGGVLIIGTGAGSNVAELNFHQDAFIGSLSMPNEAILGGNGNVTVSGLVSLSTGGGAGTVINGTGQLNANGGLTINRSDSLALTVNNRTINNAAAATTTGANAITLNSATLTNLSTGTWTENGTASYTGGTFNNQGTHIKASAGTSTISSVYNNTGTTRVTAGTLTLSNVSQHMASTLAGGTWEVSNGASLNFSSGSNITTIGANAKVTLDGAGSSFAKINSVTTNQGEFTLKNDRDFTTTGNFTNTGTVRVQGSGTVMTIGAGGTGTYTQTGGFTILEGGAMIVAATSSINGGTLAGNTTINGNLVTSGSSTIAPGFSPGVVTVNGSTLLGGGNTLAMEIGGLAQGIDYDLLDVNGVLTLGGLLNLSFVNGFQGGLQQADLFTIVTSDSAVLGSFSNVANGGFLTDTGGFHTFSVHYGAGSLYNPNDVVLSAITPEPGRAVLLLIGLSGAKLRRRRR